MADWYDLTVDELMQQQSTQRNRNGNADAETAELDTSAQPNIPPASASRSARTPRVLWDLRKTRVFVEALVTALNDGAWYRTSNKAVARAELLQCVLPRMKEEFPITVWSIAALTSKFKSLEIEMKKALRLITWSGNHYDDETGMMETTDEQWEEFERKYGDKVK
ncbi:hypothetical protein E4U58_003020 [Claviceps cyperi]|nr:hypothetical protein E4U58_003020 [Claviceps cyperi]